MLPLEHVGNICSLGNQGKYPEKERYWRKEGCAIFGWERGVKVGVTASVQKPGSEVCRMQGRDSLR